MIIFRKLITGGLSLICTGCMMQAQTISTPEMLANHSADATRGPTECATAIGASRGNSTAARLNSDDIDLFVWNIHKTSHANALNDLADLAGDMDLVLLQEANLTTSHEDHLQHADYWSFAPGYRTAESVTGVVTLSSVQPLVHCTLKDREPWIKSPKAIGITEFALSGSEQTLVVVNIHGINFTLGSSDFGLQLDKIRQAIENHNGPVIVAGDFNTWNNGREARVRELCLQLGLSDLEFKIDDRVKPFSHVIDRVLVRGLRVIDAKTSIVDSSDHNPLTVRLSI